MKTPAEFELAVRSGTPLLALVTHEERRAYDLVLHPAAARLDRVLFSWSITRGMRLARAAEEPAIAPGDAHDALSALEFAGAFSEPAIFVLEDFHHYLESPAVLRRLRDLSADLPGTRRHLVLLGPHFRPPLDLERQVEMLELPLPGMPEFEELLQDLMQQFPGRDTSEVELTPAQRENLLNACLGLTLAEADAAFARAVARDGTIGPSAIELIQAEKRQHIRRGGVLEAYESHVDLEDVGGLDQLKHWLRVRREALTREARDFGVDAPRGVLLLGVQGCGKSLTARAIAREWRMPLLRLDVGRVFGRYIGDSERTIRQVVQTAEAMAPAVLWIDEFEKGFAGSGSDAHDSGVAARVLGAFLTWLQEKEAPVFVVATANQIRGLPPELLRRGRFDEIFFVDLPGPAERQEILKLHLRARRRDPASFDLAALAGVTEGFSGSELEHLVKEAICNSFAEGRRPLRMDDLLASAGSIIPLSVTMREQISAMRQWASTRARAAGAAA